MPIRKCISFILVLCVLLSVFASVPLSVSAAQTEIADTGANVELAETGAAATNYGLVSNVQDGQILQCWNWSYNNIKQNMEKIAEQGFSAIQTSPIQPIKETTSEYYNTVQNSSWVVYQPVAFNIETNYMNAQGTKAEFQSMCEEAHRYGIKIIVDTIFNHMANDMSGNTLHPWIPSELKDNSDCWHDISMNIYDFENRYETTHYCLTGLPDLNTANSTVQKHCINFMKEAIAAGADGFRFDAIKHIETPYDADGTKSDFWPNVLNAATSYGQSTRGITPYYYGELLGSPGGGLSVTAYTEYMSVSDPGSSDRIRDAVQNSRASDAANPGISCGADPSKTVQWTESHDNYKDNGTRYVSDHNINKAWAMIGSRAQVCGMYLARPSNIDSTRMGAADITSWSYPEVKAINQFKNAFVGQSEYLSSYYNLACVERGASGMVIVNTGGTYYNGMSAPVHTMSEGTYKDAITGNTFTVSNGWISGDMGDTGIAVVYNLDQAGTFEPGKTTEFALTGSFNSWSTTSHKLVASSTTKASTTVYLSKGTYTFKLIAGELWYGATSTINDSTSSGVTMSTRLYDNLTLNASGGTYTFTYDTTSRKLLVSYSAGSTSPIYLRGSFNNWSEDNPMSFTTGSSAVSTTLDLTAGDYTFKLWNKDTDLWYGNNGTIANTTTATSSTGWDMYTDAGDCTLSASGGTYTFSFNPTTAKLIITYVAKCTATFTDWDGTVLKTQTVTSGGTPTAPTNPTRTGYTFKGWSPTVGAITENTTYVAQYTINSYAVSAVSNPTAGGTTTATPTSVNHGSNVTLKASANTGNNYSFTNWSISGTYTIVSGSLTSSTLVIAPTTKITATANYVQSTVYYTVKASAGTGGSVSPTSSSVASGGTVTLTASPATGYSFSGWSFSGAYSVVSGSANTATIEIKPTADVTATASFTGNTSTISYSAQTGGSVSNSGSFSITYPGTKTSTATATTGYTFSGWSISGGTAGTDYKITSGSTSSASITIQPLKAGKTISAVATFSANTSNINFVAGTGGSVTNAGSTAVTYPSTKSSVATATTGYTFKNWTISGGTAGADYKITSGNTSSSSITIQPLTSGNTIKATANFTINSYTVTFVDFDGSTIKTQTVNHGSAATAPSDPVREGYVFTGWDRDFSNITANITVTAQYADDTVYLLGTFNDWSTSKGAMAETSNSNIVTATYELEAGTYTFKILNLDIWYGNYGNIEDTTTATSSIGWEMVEGADDCTLTASGGTYTFNYNTSTHMLEVLHTPPSYTVTFKNYNGVILKTQVVERGQSATAPATPTRAATAQYTYTFSGWDTAFTNVQSDLTVTAQFTQTLNSYTVKFVNWDGTVLKSQTVAYGSAATAPDNPTRPADSGHTYTFSGWDKSFSRITGDTTVTALYTTNTNTYTVVFKNYDGTVLSTQTVSHGSAATAPATPSRAGNAQYSYTFKGWDKSFSSVTSDLTVTATYTQTTNKYTVTFVDYNGTVLSTQSVEYGSAATAPADPVRDGYRFVGWDVPFNNITGALTVTAVYGDNSVYLTGSFNEWALNTAMSGDGNVVTATLSLEAGTYYFKLLHNDIWYGNYGNIEDTTTATSSIGWEMVDGADNCTLTASGGTYTFNFNKSTRMLEVLYEAPSFTVKFVDYNGTVLSTQTVKKGQSATAPADPTRAASAQYTYTFAGWDKDFSNITADTTITATYSQTLNKYTVTFKNYDGTILKEQTVEYGSGATAPANPTRPDDAQYSYTFSGWDKAFTRITANTTVTAKYTPTTRDYKVEFVNYDGTVLSTQSIAYGNAATAPSATPTRPATAQYTYTFSGWDKDFSKITGDTTITAQYSSTVNKYTVTFNDYDGTVLSTQQVAYGSSATAPESPTRDADAQYTYTFKGWDKDFSNITGTLTVTATYSTTTNEYTVVFMNYDGSVLKSEQVAYGSSATAPDAPTRDGYVFIGWDVSFDYITGHTPVTAQFADNHVYLVGSFNDWQTNTAFATVSGNNVTVTLELDAGTYYFKLLHRDVWYGNAGNIEDTTTATSAIGWEMTTDTTDCTLTATGGTYTFNYNLDTRMLEVLHSVESYTVTFVDYNGTVLNTQQVAAGSAAIAPEAPTRASTTQYTYTFSGWDKDFSNITGDLTVTAQYTQELRKYTVTFKNWDGTVLSTQQVAYGTGATAPATPTRESDEQYDYTFRAWSRAFTRITSNATITATYTKTLRTFTVNFVDYNGSVISSQTITYGEAATAPESPSRAADAQYTYTFTGWDKEFTAITADTTVTAQYSRTLNKYTVTFTDYDGTVLSTQSVEYGKAATAPESPTREGYTFTGWDKSFSNITGNLTVTAQYATKVVYLVGDFNNWELNTPMSETAASGIVSVTAKLAYGTYSFKLLSDDVWYGNTGNIENTTTATSAIGWEMVDGADNCTLTASGGTYTFNFNINTRMLEVLYTPDTYTVTFKDYDGTVLSTKTVNSGEAAVAPADPSRDATAQYTYTFTGWDTDFSCVTSNLTVTATYSTTVNKYTVTFKNYDGTILSTQEVEYGSAATAPADPTRESDAQYDYTFRGWSRSFTNITANATITATYNKTVRTYTVTFVNADGTVIDKQSVQYGSAAAAPADPALDSTAQYSYTFTGWDKEFSNITGDLTVTAQYTETVNKYTVTFVDFDGTELSTAQVEYGKAATAPVAPTRAGNAQYSYTFAGWDKEFSNITGDLTVTAQYTETVNKYTVTFVDFDGTELSTSQVEYGKAATAPDAPTRAGNAQYSYTFTGWDKEFSSITGDLTVTAQYTETVNKYTVTFVDFDGTKLSTSQVEYGKTATAPVAPTRAGYTFTGWDKEFNNITGDITITAQYKSDNVYLLGDFNNWQTDIIMTGTGNILTYTLELDKNSYEFKIISGEIWLGNSGIIEDTTITTSDIGWEMVADAGNCILNASGGTYTFNFNRETRMLEILYTPNTFTVTFTDYDGTVLSTQTVRKGEAAKAPVAPQRAGNVQYSYTFAGWDKDFTNITGDLTVTAQYTQTLNKYTVTFTDFDGTVLSTQSVEYGKAATAPANPTREADAQYTYTFKAWDKSFTNITGDTTVTATYSQTTNKYTVTFTDYDGTVLSTQSVEYGKSATAPASPVRDGFTFTGWDKEFAYITGDITVTAQFADNSVYLVGSFNDWQTNTPMAVIDGTNTVTVTMRLESDTYSFKLLSNDVWYTNTGIINDTTGDNPWDMSDDPALGDCTLTATGGTYTFVFDKDSKTLKVLFTADTFTVVFKDYDGKILSTQTVIKGQAAEAPVAPQRAGDAQYSYIFNAWDTDFTNVTENLTVTATYTQVTNKYTVTFKDFDGTVLKSESVEYGKSATAPDAPTRPATAQYTYTFAGWDKEFSAVTGDLTVTAQYTETVNKYTVTFVDFDGTELSASQVEYGKAATAPESPTRAGYTFTGWDKDFSAVTGDITITAQYKTNDIYLLGDFNNWEMSAPMTATQNGNIVTMTMTLEAGDYLFKLLSGDTWYGNWGVIEDTTTATSDIGWEMSPDADNCTLRASGGTYTFNFNIETKMLEVLFTAPTYTVIFKDYDGTVLSTQTVTRGESATAPEEPSREGHDFAGWDKDFSDIQSDTTITATYTEIQVEYTVTFKNYDGTVLSTQTVIRGEAAAAPADPTREADAQYTYTFSHWDTDFSSVTRSMTVTAVFTRTLNKYTVTFTDYDGTILKTQEVAYGESATAPEVSAREGFTFTGWDKEFSNITGELTVTAQYTDIRAYLTGTFNNWELGSVMTATDGNILTYTITLEEGTYKFKITQGGKWYGNPGVIEDTTTATSDIGWEMTEDSDDCTLNASGGTYTFNFNPETRMLEVIYVAPTYTVVFKDHDGTILSTQTIKRGEDAVAPEAPSRDGYIFFGWDTSFTGIKADTTITAVYTAIEAEYTVTFKNFDGTVISTQTVKHGESATAPENDPVRAADAQYTYTFAGWDTELTNILRDTTITALFIRELNKYTVTFVDNEGNVIDTQQVEYGKSATAPEVPAKEGFIFRNWDKDFSEITGDLTVTAEYFEDIYYLMGSFNEWADDTPFTATENEEVITVEVTLMAGTYYFKLSHAGEWYSNTGVIEDTTIATSEIGWEMVNDSSMGDCTLTASGGTYTFNFNKTTKMLEVLYTPVEYTVTFVNSDGTEISSQLVKFGAAAVAPEEDPTMAGFIFSGWDKEFGCITGDTVVTATYVPDTTKISVYFIDYNGKVLSIEEVTYGEAATAPEVPQREGFMFIGWDKEFDCITESINVTALYKDIRFYLVGSFNEWSTDNPMQGDEDGIVYTMDLMLAPGTYTFKLLHDSVWYSNFGTVANTTDPAEDGWFMDSNEANDCTLTATGGKYTFTYNSETGMLKITYTPESYTVTFKDHDGTEISSQQVIYGANAVAPDDPTREDYIFTGWDKEFTGITEDTVVTATYILNTTLHTVTFVDHDGTELKVEEVIYGNSATAPEVPKRPGYTFIGWDKEFSKITGDMVITALYKDNQLYLVGSFNDWATDAETSMTLTDDDVTYTKDVMIGAGTHYFKLLWNDVWYSNTGIIEDTTTATSEIGWEMTEVAETVDCTLIATGGKYTFNYNPETGMLEILFTPVNHTVKFTDHDGTEISSQTVSYGAAAVAPENDPTREGYIFSGWDKEFTCICEDTVITATYVADDTLFTVQFVDHDGTVLKEEKLTYGLSATAPEAPKRAGYTFIGWDKEFTKITGDTVITAQYKDNQLYLVGSFNEWLTDTPFRNTGDGITYSVDVTLMAGDYFFKLLCNDVWYTNTIIINDTTDISDNLGWELFIDPTLGDCALIATGGKYTFLFNIESNVLRVVHTVIKNTVTFKDYDGTVLSTQNVSYGASAIAPAAPTREKSEKYTYIFRGWDKDYTCITQDTVLTATYDEILNVYTVTFMDSQGYIIDTQSVQYGMAATSPVAPEVEGMDFLRWDKDISCITGDLVVTAVYAEEGSVHVVTFTDPDGNVLYTQYVLDGEAASAPEAPAKEGYIFKGWDTSFDNVTTDLTVKAVYTRLFTVIFVDDNGTVLDTQTVAEGESANAPSAPYRDGYAFTGWDKSYSNVTSDLTVTAKYMAVKVSNVTIAGEFNGWNSAATPLYYGDDESTVFVTLNLAQGTYKFKIVNNGEWQGNYGTIDDTTDYTSDVGWEMDPYAGDCTLNASGGTYTFIYNPSTRMLIIKYAVEASEFEVVFMSYDGTTVLKTQTVKKGESATPPAGPYKPADQYGSYTFTGWDKDYTNVTTPLTLYPTYDMVPVQFLVRFVDYNGAVLKSEYVGYDGYSGPPADPTRAGYIFTGWSGEFWNVTSNRTITATYMDNRPYIMGDFNNWEGTSMKAAGGTIYTATMNLAQGWYKFKIKQGWDWFGNNGTIDDSTAYTSDTGWDMSWDAGDCTLNAAGGTYTFRFNTSTKKLIILYNAPTYTVKFVDWNGRLLSSQTVARGRSATPPDDPKRAGYIFSGWSGEWWYITANSTFTATYAENAVDLMGDFNDWSGTRMTALSDNTFSTTMKLSGGSYKFKVKVADTWYGNSGTIENTTVITSDIGWEMVWNAGDCTLNASGGTYVFTFNTDTRMLVIEYMTSTTKHTVTFVDYDGTVLKTETVTFGSAATAPAAPTRTGYSFVGWDKAFNYVTENLTVTAVYSDEMPYLIGGFTDWQQTMPMSPTEEDKNIVSVAVKLPAGEHKFKVYHSTVWYGNDGTIEDTTTKTSDIGWEMNPSAGDCTLKATGGTYVFNFNLLTKMLEVLLVNDTYSVVFVDHDGTVLSTQNVAYGSAATAPAAPTREGFMFVGWDKSFTSIKADTVITARYIDPNITLVGTFTDEKGTQMTVKEGSAVASATVELEAGEYTFNIKNSTASFGGNDIVINNTTADISAIGVQLVIDGDACVLKALGGVYHFMFDAEKNMLIISTDDQGDEPGLPGETTPDEPDLPGDTTPDEEKPTDPSEPTDPSDPSEETFTATWNDGDSFTITTDNDPDAIVSGSDFTFGVTVKDGYVLKAVVADMKIITPVDGVYTITNVTSNVRILVIVKEDVVVEVPEEVHYYTVVFTDSDGKVLSTQLIKEGEAAVAPTVPATYKDAQYTYNFRGWIGDFSEITADSVFTTNYVTSDNYYNVTFVGSDGKTIATQRVKYGSAATAPTAPAVEGYTFKGWDVDFTNITGDTTVTARYSKVIEPATTGSLKIQVPAGRGFTIAFGDDAPRTQGPSYYNSFAPIGVKVTVTALPYSNGAAFIGWINTANGLILSNNETYSFYTSGNDFIKAMYKAEIDGVQMVVFKNDKANQHLDVQYYSANDTIEFPTVVPQMLGYEFKGWNMTAEQILAEIAKGNDVTVTPIWNKVLTYVDVTVSGGTADGTHNDKGQFLLGEAVTVKADAPASGKKFAYWTDASGNVRSYNETYTFYLTGATTLTAVYVGEDEAIDYQILLSVDNFTPGDYGTFTVSWFVPEKYEFVGGGIIAVNKDNYNESTFVHGSTDTNVWDRTGSDTLADNTFNWTGPVFSGQTWYAKCWVQYKDENGVVVTLYSDMFTAIKD